MNNYIENKTNIYQLHPRNNMKSIRQPALVLMNNWKYWLAREILRLWQISPTQDFQPLKKEILNIVGQQIMFASQNSLKREIEQIKAKTMTVHDIEKAEKAINIYSVKTNLCKVEKLVKFSESKRDKKISQLILAHLRDVNPKKMTLVFEDLCSCLKTQKNELEKKRLEYFKKSSLAYQTYSKLLGELKLLSCNTEKFKSAEESLWNNMSLYFELNLKAEVYSLYLQRVWSLSQLCKNYYNPIKSTSNLLSEIQNSLEKKSQLESITFPVCFYFSKIDPEVYKVDMETCFGTKINDWGYLNVSWQQIEKKLLEIIEPYLMEDCIDFQSRFLELDLQ